MYTNAVMLSVQSKISQSWRFAAKQYGALKAVLSSSAFVFKDLSEADHQQCVRKSPEDAPQPFKGASEKISRTNLPKRILLN